MDEQRHGEGVRSESSERTVGDDEEGSEARLALRIAWAWFPLGEHIRPLRDPLRRAVAEALGETPQTSALSEVRCLVERYWADRVPVELDLLLRRVEAAARYSGAAESRNADQTA